ncbi:DNA-damage-repair/toleration protein DRT111 [Diplonema papillatum]|nr:DNA-damage-repair/toleration protein DRT111 [Diplonema papillatum]
MALIEELDDDFVPDIVNELESFGKVETCEVVVADPVAYPSLIPQERVRVFVRFANYQAAMQALVNLDGRTYAGKQIAGHLYDDIRASLGDFLPSETSEPPLPLRCLI